MALRESNALHLEILEVLAGVGVPLEVDIFDGANPGTLLEHLEGAYGVTFSFTLNEMGSFSFRINRHDPKARPEIVDRENLCKIKIGGVYRFAGWMSERAIETLDEDAEEAGEDWIIGGSEALIYLDRAVWAPVSYASGGSFFLDEETGVWSFALEEAGDVMARAIVEARGRSPDPLEFLTFDFHSNTDSQGAAWPDLTTIDANAGTGYLQTLRTLAGLGLCDFRMRHDLRLSMYVELGRHFEVGTGTGSVVFRAGQNVTTKLRKRTQGGEKKSRLWVKGKGDAFFEVQRPDIEADPYTRRREGFLSFGDSSDPTTIQRAGEADLESRSLQGNAISFGVDHVQEKGGYQPFVDYDLGDWTTLDDPGVWDMEPVRIVGLTITQAEDDYDVQIDANSIEYEALLKLARRLNGASSGGSSGTASTNLSGGGGGSGGGSTAPTSRVSVEAGDTPGFLLAKLLEGTGIDITLAGTAGGRKAQISAEVSDADLAAIQAELDAHEGLPHTGGYVLDGRPGAPNAMDDEFDGPTLDPKWTKDASWSASAAETFDNSELRKEFPIAASGAASRMLISQPVPAGDWTFACKMTHVSTGNPSTATADTPMFGLYLLDAVGTGVANAVYNSTVGEAFPFWRFVTNAFSARAGYSTVRLPFAFDMQVAPVWLRIRRAGATYFAAVSLNGRDWLPEWTYTGAAITPTIVGVGKGYNTPQAGRFWIDWFRRLA